MKLTQSYSSLLARVRVIRRLNPVNAGLLGAANEFEAALQAKTEADARFSRALVDFVERVRRDRAMESKDLQQGV